MPKNTRIGKVAKVAKSQAARCSCYRERTVHLGGTIVNQLPVGGAAVKTVANFTCECGFEKNRMDTENRIKVANYQHNLKRNMQNPNWNPEKDKTNGNSRRQQKALNAELTRIGFHKPKASDDKAKADAKERRKRLQEQNRKRSENLRLRTEYLK